MARGEQMDLAGLLDHQETPEFEVYQETEEVMGRKDQPDHVVPMDNQVLRDQQDLLVRQDHQVHLVQLVQREIKVLLGREEVQVPRVSMGLRAYLELPVSREDLVHLVRMDHKEPEERGENKVNQEHPV